MAQNIKTEKYFFWKEGLPPYILVKTTRASPYRLMSKCVQTRCTSFSSECHYRFSIVHQMAPLPRGPTGLLLWIMTE